ncbi:glycoside hydrolase domain-containing protein [Gracilibacillus sp. JCM 18860]|uniref:glycoside hydrolase domain-containing protein n=1 Tax=Gracilibacillus sp. JCM 18860 TaxID=1306159 RepID=UPI000B17E789
MADPRVLEVQLWVNTTYEGKYGFNSAPENGKTGWSTVYALTRALQIELGISQPADNFGQGTSRAYRNYGELELGNAPTDNKGKRIVKIFQGACYCKGYDPGSFDGVFTEVTQQAVIDLQTDAGLPIRDGKVYDYIFKAFLVMDAYRLTGNGDTKIQSIQRDLNYHYYQTAGVCPCDGHYQRNTNKALIYGIQTEEGIAPPELQTGTVGPSTRALLPTLSVGSSGTFVKLFQYALYFNGYDVGAFDGGVYGNSTKQTVMNFQEFTALTVDGIAGKQTWLSALISTGDPTRRGTACDCITEITPARAQTLVDEGYETVGRYLVNVEGGLNKKIQPGELATIFNAGLTVFPIFQTIGDSASYFTYNQGKSDAEAAYDAARKYGFHYNTTIYFAVDFDAYGYQITDNVVPYFQGINATMHSLGGFYQIGVYGPRSVGITVSDQGLATTSFVSGMSTGFSGNLGYPLPDNWAFDQISTISIGSGVGYINIDNNIKSGRDEGASSVSPADYDESINNLFFDQIDAIYDIALNHSGNDQADANKLLCHYLRHKNYNGFLWATTAGILDSEFIDKVNDQLNSPEIINPFDVTFETRLDTPHFAATLNSILFIWGVEFFYF